MRSATVSARSKACIIMVSNPTLGMEVFSNISYVVRSLQPGRYFAPYPQGVSIQKTSLSTLVLCYTYPKLD